LLFDSIFVAVTKFSHFKRAVLQAIPGQEECLEKDRHYVLGSRQPDGAGGFYQVFLLIEQLRCHLSLCNPKWFQIRPTNDIA
jgi:hypothetical protein